MNEWNVVCLLWHFGIDARIRFLFLVDNVSSRRWDFTAFFRYCMLRPWHCHWSKWKQTEQKFIVFVPRAFLSLLWVATFFFVGKFQKKKILYFCSHVRREAAQQTNFSLHLFYVRELSRARKQLHSHTKVQSQLSIVFGRNFSIFTIPLGGHCFAFICLWCGCHVWSHTSLFRAHIKFNNAQDWWDQLL